MIVIKIVIYQDNMVMRIMVSRVGKREGALRVFRKIK
jgi:hypothetical protein